MLLLSLLPKRLLLQTFSSTVEEKAKWVFNKLKGLELYLNLVCLIMPESLFLLWKCLTCYLLKFSSCKSPFQCFRDFLSYLLSQEMGSRWIDGSAHHQPNVA
jgi:hypothetical protein